MAFMSGLWNSIVGGSDKEVDWAEVSQFYLDKTKKYFSVSEVDKEDKPVVYGAVHNISFNKTGLGLDFVPITFITNYYIDTRKGLFFCCDF